jgi:hypothetical protein
VVSLSDKTTAAARQAILHRCRDAAYVWDRRDAAAHLNPRQEALLRRTLDELVEAGQIRRIDAAPLVVYISW